MNRSFRLVLVVCVGAAFAACSGNGSPDVGIEPGGSDAGAVTVDDTGSASEGGTNSNVSADANATSDAASPDGSTADGAPDPADGNAPSDGGVPDSTPSNGIPDPLNLHVSSLSQLTATLAWSEPAGGPYLPLFVYAVGAPPVSCEGSVGTIGPFSGGAPGTTQLALNGLSPGTGYGVRVCYENPAPSAVQPDPFSLGATISFTTLAYDPLPNPEAFLANGITKTTANVSWEYTGPAQPGGTDGFNGFSITLVQGGTPPASCDPDQFFGGQPYQNRYTLGLSDLLPGTVYSVRICTRRIALGGPVLSSGLTGTFTTKPNVSDAGSDASDAGTDAAPDGGPALPPTPTYVSCDTNDIGVRWSGTAPLYRVIEKQTPIDATCGGGTVIADVAGINSYLLSQPESAVVYICGYDGSGAESPPLKIAVNVPFTPGTGAVTCTKL